jgi:N-acetylglucosamine-6-phosphate deacetylase
MFDLQINGAFGVDFNAQHITPKEAIQCAHELSQRGIQGWLATIITDSDENLRHKLRQWRELLERQPELRRCVRGIHLEGPCLSPHRGYIGAHPPEHVQLATPERFKPWLDAAGGYLKLVTLAPEQDPGGRTTAWLRKQGIVVAAGHTNADREQLLSTLDAGLSGFTHLGNGCPTDLPRHDNILLRVMSLRHHFDWISVIADGDHVPFWLLELWLEWFGTDRLLVVSDAMSGSGMPSGHYPIGQQSIYVDPLGVPRSGQEGLLAGSGATLDTMWQRLAEQLGWTASTLTALCVTNPQRTLLTHSTEQASHGTEQASHGTEQASHHG